MNKCLCDQCGNDLSTTPNAIGYRLALTTETIPCHDKGSVTMMMVYPPIDRDKHFCGFKCLKLWVEAAT